MNQMKTIIDLSGPEGNAYHMLAIADERSRKLNLDKDKILSEMKSSGYTNLLDTFLKYFGDDYEFTNRF